METTAKKRELSLTEGPLVKNIIRYTIPIILTGLLQLAFNAADLIVVGQFSGGLSVAAVGSTSAITTLIVNFFITFATGSGVTVAQGLGARDDKEVHKTVHTAIPVAVIAGIIITLIGVLFSENFLRMMKTPHEVIHLATLYMRVYFSGTIFLMIYNFCAAILRASGDTKSPLIYLTIAGFVNVILNVIFVTIFRMNVVGVALATAISQFVSAVLVVIKLMRRTDSCKLMLSKLKIYKRPLLQIVGIGLPMGIQSTLFGISNTLIQASINSFNNAALVSGNAAACSIEGFVYVVINSFNQTATNFVGQNVGAKKLDRVKKVFKTCLGLVCVLGLTAGSLIYLLGPILLKAYIPDSAEAIDWGMIRILYICIPFFLCGIMDVATGVLIGMGESLAPMIISVIGVCGFRVIWIYTIFKEYHTIECLYTSYPVTWALTFTVEAIVVLHILKKRIKE